jgi:hypothetical protein
MTSASAPAGTAPRNIGRVDATCTIETMKGAGLRLVISQPDAALEIQPPMLEITVAIQRTVNARCRKGLHREGDAGALAAALASALISWPSLIPQATASRAIAAVNTQPA